MVTSIDKSHIQLSLNELFGIDFVVNEGKNYIDLRPADLTLGEGFAIRISFSWRSLICDFIPDNYAAALLNAMGSSTDNQKELFRTLYSAVIQNSSIQIEMLINRSSFDPGAPSDWPIIWRNVQLSMKVMSFVFENMKPADYEQIVMEWGGRMLSMILSLIPMETEEEDIDGFPEGALSRIEVNKYERNLINRQACLLIHGTDCKVCGFSFESRYGFIGRGYIHVHHVTPLSKMGENYKVNPSNDLIPVCPNCHAMLHKRNPPYTVEELKLIIEKNAK